MESFLFIVIKASSVKDGRVRNVWKFDFKTIFFTFNNARKYDLTSDRRFYNHKWRSYIFTNVSIFWFQTYFIVSDLSRKVGPEVLCNLIFRERRNYFSKSGRVFVGFYFLLELIFTHTHKSSSVIANHHPNLRLAPLHLLHILHSCATR